MKKAELRGMPVLKVTEKIRKMVAEDRCEKKHTRYPWYYSYETYKHYLYYRAVVSNGILKLAIFSRKHVAAGGEMPQFEVYIDREAQDWINYEPETGKWLTAKLDMLNYDYDTGHIYGSKPYADDVTKKLVNEYMGTGKKEVREAILSWQVERRKDQLQKKHKNELEAIDMVMDAVPDYPKDFDDWVIKYGFYDCRYIFYQAGKKAAEGLCTHCGKTVQMKERPYHNHEGKCPVCHSPVTYKAWNKQKSVIDEKYIALFQRLTDESGYILRKFHFKIARRLEKGWDKYDGGAWEDVRIKLDNNFREVDQFEFGEYKNTGIDRWCHQINHGGYSYGWYGVAFESSVLYSSNIRQVLKGSSLKYFPLKELLEANRGKKMAVRNLFGRLQKHPEYEFLAKAGLKRLTFTLLADGEYSNNVRVNPETKRPWEYLRLTKEQFQICCKKNATADEVRVIQMANENGVKIGWQQAHWIASTLGKSLLIEYMKYTTPHKMIRYLREALQVESNRDKAKDYYDYLRDLRKLDLVSQEHLLYPQNFDRAHEETHLEVLEKEEAEKAAEKRRKDLLYQKTMKSKQKLLAYEDQNYLIVIPTCKEDFVTEGRNMHNCVGGYFDRVVNGECIVLFLREKSDPEKSFCTVEIRGTKLIQCRSINNGRAPEQAEQFMEKYLKELRKRLDKEEKQKAKVKVPIAAAV